MTSEDVAVLVVSCDKYRDLWGAFFTLFFRYWPDCPYPVYLGSNHQLYADSRIKTITVGDDRDWSSGVLKMLKQIPYTYLIVLLEDYLFYKRVDTLRITGLVSYLKKKNAACLRLFPCPGPDENCSDNAEVGEIRKGARWRLSLQPAIWDRQMLINLIREGETPWEFEVKGSIRTNKLNAPFLSVNEDAIKQPLISYFCTAVVRGKWMRDAVRLCEKEGIKIDLSIRQSETLFDHFKRSVIFDTIEKYASLLSKWRLNRQR